MSVSKELYEVVETAPNGLRIAGLRRVAGEQIEMSEDEAQFLVLEGVIRKAAAPAPKGKAKPAADPAA